MLISFLGIFMLCALHIKIGISLLQCEVERTFRTDRHFDNLLPANSNYSLQSFEDIHLIFCGIACSKRLPVCVGFLYNRRMMFCKLLKIHLNKNVVSELHDGWKFYYDNKACDSGWTPYNGHCYLIGNTLISWSNSQIQCQNYGAYVLEIESEQENMWIIETFLPRNESDCSQWRYCTVWVGATDRDIEGTFTWIRNKKELAYLPWGNGQPDDKNGQDCIRLSSSGKWKDARCDDVNQINYICEKN